MRMLFGTTKFIQITTMNLYWMSSCMLFGTTKFIQITTESDSKIDAIMVVWYHQVHSNHNILL